MIDDELQISEYLCIVSMKDNAVKSEGNASFIVSITPGLRSWSTSRW